jgi:hypothetical protein
MEEWNIENIKEYISQFKTRKQFEADQEYNSIRDFFKGYRGGIKTWNELISGLEGVKKNRDLEYAKKYIEDNKFETYQEFEDSPEYDAINSSIYTKYGPQGWAELVSVLEKQKESWTLEKAVDYISQFSSFDEFKNSKKFMKIKKFIDRWKKENPSQPEKWMEVTSKLPRTREDWTIEKIEDYLSQFTSFNEFENSEKYKAINSWVYRKREGIPFKGPEIWKDLTSKLEKGKLYKGEEKVVEVLKSLGYSDVEQNKQQKGCISFKSTDVKCFLLKFDAYFIDEKGNEIFIEYDGVQHFEPVDYYGGELRYNDQVKNDIIKNQYTKDKGLKLIRIGYKDFNNIENEIKAGLASPNQLFLSSKYPKAGWNGTMDDIMKPNLKKEYIVTESQLKTIVESKSAFIEKLRRRFNEKTMRDYIYHVETEFPNPCEQFDNEFEYADTIINQAVDDFLFQDELWEYFHSGDWPVVKITDMMVTMCKEWFEDGLLGFHQTTCQDEFDNEDFDVMSEEYEIASDKVIVRLFKLFNEYKKKSKTKKELLNTIMEYLPLFGISKVYAIYMLELYLLNYREDGDYSGLNKNNFIDPRNKSGKKTANYQAGDYTKAQLPFQGSNLEGRWTKDRNGVKYYVVKSYGWYPVYIYKEGKWYENFDRYSNSTSKQMLRSRPYTYNNEIDTNVYLMSKKEMEMLESGYSHEDVMKKKKESLKDFQPSPRITTAKSETWRGDIPSLNIKFKISSIEDLGDKNAVNVDIYDVFKTENYKQIPTPENYLKGEIPNVTPEKIEKEVERKLRQNFSQYLGPKLGNQDEELVTFRFNHLKK